MNSRYRLPEGVVQVMNEKSKLVHLFCPRSERVACAAWNAGTPENPTTNADFASSSGRWDQNFHDVRFCVNCHALRTISKLGDPLFVTMRPSRLRTHRLRSPRRAVPPLNVFLFIIVYFVFYLGLPFVFCLLPCCPGVAWCPGVTPRWHNSTRSMVLI